MERWADAHDILFLLITFSIIKKNESEIVSKFNTLFSSFHNRIHNTIRPNTTHALVYYLEAFDGIFGIFFRSKEPQTLEEAQAATIKLEGHFLATYGFLPIRDFQPSVATGMQEVLDIEDEPQLAPF
jgi:hypothetical protein